jgi:hypothetical protein
MLIFFFIIGILSASVSGYFTLKAIKHLTEKGKRDSLFIFVFISSPRSMLKPYFDADGMLYLSKARITGYITILVLIFFGLSALFGK